MKFSEFALQASALIDFMESLSLAGNEGLGLLLSLERKVVWQDKQVESRWRG